MGNENRPMLNKVLKYKNLIFVGLIILVVLVVAVMSNNSKNALNSKASTPADPLEAIKIEDIIVVVDKDGYDVECSMVDSKYVCETTGDLVQIDLNKDLKKGP